MPTHPFHKSNALLEDSFEAIGGYNEIRSELVILSSSMNQNANFGANLLDVLFGCDF